MEKASGDAQTMRLARCPPGNVDVKDWKERETRRWNVILNELRTKKDREKQEALVMQKEAMNRAFRAQLSKLSAERDELQRKVKHLESKTESTAPKTFASNHEVHKLTCENAALKNEKKKLEETFHAFRESEQKRCADLRNAVEQKNAEISQLQRQTRQEVTRLLEECKAKDRVISYVENEVRAQSCRAEQFRDILERSLVPRSQRNPLFQGDGDDVNGRERQLRLQVTDLQEKMRHLQEAFSHEKRELIRRLKESEEQQAPLRQKNKQYLLRNVHLASENRRLNDSLKEVQQPTTTMQREKSNLKRSLTRPNLNSIDSAAKNDKQRRAEYVKQVQKLRKEQRYYSMWELPPLLEVDTDSAAEASDASAGSLSPGTSSGIPSSCSDTWNEEARRELELLFSQLSREHAELQRSYQILHDRLNRFVMGVDSDVDYANYSQLQQQHRVAKNRIAELEEMLQLQQSQQEKPRCRIPSLLEVQAKFVREKHALQARLNLVSATAEEAKLKCAEFQAEANELRDQNELLEFRILELEECQEKASSRCSSPRDRKDVCTDTDSDDLSLGDSGVVSLASFTCGSPPLASPLAVHDGDYLNEKLQSLRAPLSSVIASMSNASHKSALLQLQALLEVCQGRLNTSKQSEPTTIDKVNSWELHLQESGIFDEDITIGDVTVETQTEATMMCHSSAQTRAIQQRSVAVQMNAAPAESRHAMIQTSEQVISVSHLRDLEKYYDEQIDILQKERHELRKTLQDERIACEKRLSQAEQLETNYLQLQQLLEEKEEQFEVAFKKYRQFHDQEVELCKSSTRGDIAILKECLQMIWHEIKDVTYVPETCETSLMEFTQNVLSGVQFICSELPKLQIKVAHLSQLEHAFQTTLQQADGLVRDIEMQHLERIRWLERSEQDLKKQVEFFQCQLSNSSLAEHTGDSSLQAVELGGKIQEVQKENETLTLKWREVQDHCQRLQNRIEELELVENALRESIAEMERRHSLREQRLKEEQLHLQAELEKRQESESKWETRLEKKQLEVVRLKEKLDEEERLVDSLKTELKNLESRLEKEDSSFKNEVSKLRAHLNLALSQLNELELLNCQLREQLCECRSRISDLEKHIADESSQKEKLREENTRLLSELQNPAQTKTKSLTDELREVNFAAEASLEDFEEISLAGTPTGLENGSFDEHVRVLESLECFLDRQDDNKQEFHLSDTPNAQDLQLQLAELQEENQSLRSNLQSTESQKNNVIRILLEQLRSREENCPSAAEDVVEAIQPNPVESTNVVSVQECVEQVSKPAPVRQNRKELKLPDEDPLLEAPTDFRVTRTVGKDGVVVAWTPPQDDSVAGYLICVNEEESQRVRSAQRTKAVLCGLDLRQALDIRIYSLSIEDRISPPSSTTYPASTAGNNSSPPQQQQSVNAEQDPIIPREVVVQTFYTNSSVTVRSSRVAASVGSKIPVRTSVP